MQVTVSSSGARPVRMYRSGPGCIEREAIPGIPLDISARMREVSVDGKLVE
jgi:hypothetical protein